MKKSEGQYSAMYLINSGNNGLLETKKCSCYKKITVRFYLASSMNGGLRH